MYSVVCNSRVTFTVSRVVISNRVEQNRFRTRIASPSHRVQDGSVSFFKHCRVNKERNSEICAKSTGINETPNSKDEGIDAFRSAMESSYSDSDDGEEDFESQPMTGEELRALVVGRWGRSYDTRILQRRNKINQMKLYLQVMWKFLGQKSFPLSEKKYMEQLNAVAELLTEWGVADQVREDIKNCKKNPVLDTTGANAVAILLKVDPIMK